MAATAGNGVVAKTIGTSQNDDMLLRFDGGSIPTVESWGAPDLQYYALGHWVGSSGSLQLLSGVAVEFADSVWVEAEQGGRNQADGKIDVQAFSTAGAPQAAIQGMLQAIKDALPAYSACANWFSDVPSQNGNVASMTGQNWIDSMLTWTPPIYGHGAFDELIAAFSFPDSSVSGVPVGISMVVNTTGFFFQECAHSGGRLFPVGGPKYTGGTPQAKASILIHEIGHLARLKMAPLKVVQDWEKTNSTQVPLRFLQDKFTTTDERLRLELFKKAGKFNDETVEYFCGPLIRSIQ